MAASHRNRRPRSLDRLDDDVGVSIHADHSYGGETEDNGMHGAKNYPRRRTNFTLYFLIFLGLCIIGGGAFVGIYGTDDLFKRSDDVPVMQPVKQTKRDLREPPGGQPPHQDAKSDDLSHDRRGELERRRKHAEDMARRRREKIENMENKEHSKDSKEVLKFHQELRTFDERTRTIILSSGGGRWNTGVWTGWGGEQEVELMWAAAGVKVSKECPFQCHFTRDETLLPKADAVVMETINHLKFLGYEKAKSLEIEWPEKREYPIKHPRTGRVPSGKAETLPVVGQFYYEPTHGNHYDFTISPEIQKNIDFRVVPGKDKEIPITLVCPWGRDSNAFLNPPPERDSEHLIAYFNEHGNDPAYNEFVDRLFNVAGYGIHSYLARKNQELPEEAGGNPFRLENRLNFLSKYKFHLVTESVIQEDWVSPEWSQTFIAGVVPVYIGAPNIEEFAPGPKSFVNAKDFQSAEDLWNYLQQLNDNDAEYQQYHEWKKQGLSETFKTKLSQCAHYAECRICEFVTKRT